jgi:hypothetical protein
VDRVQLDARTVTARQPRPGLAAIGGRSASGKRGRLRIAYGDPRKPETAEPAVKWLWRYVDGARTAGELYGRALVVIAAEQYACRLVVPSFQQGSPIRYGSHADRAEKALAKLASPHLPASVKQLQKAIDRVDAEHEAACAATRKISVQTTDAHRGRQAWRPRDSHESSDNKETLGVAVHHPRPVCVF